MSSRTRTRYTPRFEDSSLAHAPSKNTHCQGEASASTLGPSQARSQQSTQRPLPPLPQETRRSLTRTLTHSHKSLRASYLKGADKYAAASTQAMHAPTLETPPNHPSSFQVPPATPPTRQQTAQINSTTALLATPFTPINTPQGCHDPQGSPGSSNTNTSRKSVYLNETR